MFYNYNNTNEFQFENPFYQFSFFLSFVPLLRSCRVFQILSLLPVFGGRKNEAVIHTMPTRGSAHGRATSVGSKVSAFKADDIVIQKTTSQRVRHSNLSFHR
jgi:hypothetical protein